MKDSKKEIGKNNGWFDYSRKIIWLVAISFVIRVIIALMTNEGGDPAWHLNVARFIGQNHKIPLFEFLGRDAFFKPPLFHIVGGIFYNLFGIFGSKAAEIGIKMVSPLAGTGLIVFTYLIAKELTNKKTAFYAALFTSFFPLSIYLSVTGHTEMTASFFIAGTIYFLLKKKRILCGIFFGLSLLSKEFAVMLYPLVFIYFITKRKTEEKPFKKMAIILAVATIIAAPWYIRNWVLLGNPFWPFFISVLGAKYIYPFGLRQGMSISSVSAQSGPIYQIVYLEFFGVPSGRIDNLMILNLPKIILGVWFIATLAFVIPIVIGLFKNKIKSKGIIFSLIFLFLFVLVITTFINYSTTARYFYAIPALAVLWGVGAERLVSKYGKYALILILLICIGFVFAEGVKAKTGSDMWNFYKEDFNWVQENTPKDALFLAGGQAMPYKLHRNAAYLPEKERMYPSFIPELEGFDYVFINQGFKLGRAMLDEGLIAKIKENEKFKLIYYNNKTKTEIYKRAS